MNWIVEQFINPGLLLLPMRMDTPEARVLLIAIGLQESRFQHRFQIGTGPARGFWQFEQGGGIRGVLSHHQSIESIRHVCRILRIEPSTNVCYQAVAWNDALACCFARLLLWTLPRALPKLFNMTEAWFQYLEAWRPGRPHPDTWPEMHRQAVEIIQQNNGGKTP